MTRILHINTSIFGDTGQSSQLADSFINQWRARDPDIQVLRRDLANNPIPHLDATVFQAAVTPREDRTPEQTGQAALADALIAELQASDVIVLGVPMYNFNVPSSLKAWFDHVARAGTTFRYTSSGPEGLLHGKKVYVFAARGGVYANTGRDWQTPYIREFLGFLGFDDVEFVYAEGLNLSGEEKDRAIEAANNRINSLAA